MCGIAGFLDTSGQRSEASLLEIAQRMSTAVAHRGPDDQGHWADPSAGIAFGFRRLSIIDISPTGHQPMVSASGRFVIIFNGEIYNYEELRAELTRNFAAKLRGSSDTEVMLLGFDSWGIEPTLRKLNGMFAMPSGTAPNDLCSFAATVSERSRSITVGWAARFFSARS